MTQLKEAIDIMRIWWWKNEMIINENKSGILRILKRSETKWIIKNSLNIIESETYKYLGVVINQSLTTKQNKDIIKTKVTALKRRIWKLKPSLVNQKSYLLISK